MVRVSREYRRAARRAEVSESHEDDNRQHIVVVPSHEGPISARDTLRALEQCTTPERWRAWLLFAVDGVSAREIARQEGRPLATIHNLLRLAKRDFTAAVRRPRSVTRRA